MTFQELFNIYYPLYRGDSAPTDITDPEWALAINFYNDAVQRMAKYDDTKWNFLYKTLQTAATGTKTLSSATTYTAPTDMQEPGGYLTFIDSSSNRTNVSLVRPYQAQSLSTTSSYGYFTGDETSGFTLHLNPAPSGTAIGKSLDYAYYRKPIVLSSSETGSSNIEGGDPAYYYNHMLAQRFRTSRNYPSYQTALSDSEEALKGMKIKNNSGTHYNAWTLLDTSGTGWGV